MERVEEKARHTEDDKLLYQSHTHMMPIRFLLRTAIKQTLALSDWRSSSSLSLPPPLSPSTSSLSVLETLNQSLGQHMDETLTSSPILAEHSSEKK